MKPKSPIDLQVAPKALPVATFASMLGISVWTARRMAYTGTIASLKLGKKLLIPAGEVDRLLASNIRPAREQHQ